MEFAIWNLLLLFVTILTFFIVLSVLVLVHEFGHFMMAKFFGVKVLEFGIGLPPRLFGVKKGETVYSVNALPIGGFVRLHGEEEATTEDKSDLRRAFYKKGALPKLFIITGGVLMNFLLAVVIISYIFTQGVYVPTQNVYIESVSKKSPAEAAGLKKNDIVRKIGVDTITSPDELIKATNKYLNKKMKVTVERGKQTYEFEIVPRKNPPKDEGALGIQISNLEFKKYSLMEAPIFGLVESMKMSILMARGIVDVVTRLIKFAEVPTEVAGPVGIARLVGQAAQYGFMAVLQLTGILSLNLAVINIFPFPALDGGRLIFVLIELVTRRRVNPRLEAIVNSVGLAILIGLIFLVTRNDILRK